MRARLPKLLGVLAVVGMLVCIGVVAVSIYRSRQQAEFRMQGFPASLSKEVVATVFGYERREMDGDRLKYYIRADKAVSFADNHQELENAYFEVYGEDGGSVDKLSAQKAVYVPAENKNFTAYLAGAVNIETRDQLKVKTEQLTYTSEHETAIADETVDFERVNIRGRSASAIVRVKEKRLELDRDVAIREMDEAGGERSTLSAGRAVYDQVNEKIDLAGNMTATTTSVGSPPRLTTLSAARGEIYMANPSDGTRAVERAQLFENVAIRTTEGTSSPTTISAQYALYEKSSERIELRDGVHIVTSEDEQPTEVRAARAVYEQPQGRIHLTGGSSVAQRGSSATGDSINVQLDAQKKVKNADVVGNAVVRQAGPDRTAEVTGPKINAAFGEDQSIAHAAVAGSGEAVLVPARPSDFTRFTLTAEKAIDINFKGQGLLSQVVTQGRSSAHMEVPNIAPDSANKSITADSLSTTFAPNGKDVSRAVASGNAELVAAPLSSSESNYKTVINAPRFECDFFQTGSDPRSCAASGGTKTVRTPTVSAPDRGTQVITSKALNAAFAESSRALDAIEASGDAKFAELDRNATAEKIFYSTADQTVRLRGGDPVVWDGKARAKAPEIDWNTGQQVSELRGGASTTYYSPGSAGGATPFSRSEKPVYVTANSARFDHRSEVAVFTGNARGWQEKNYVRGERLMIAQREGRFVVEENVQSLLYESSPTAAGKKEPIFAAAKKLTYLRADRLVRYEEQVDIRQGKDRVTGGAANIFLSEQNEPVRTEVERNVIITQPNRRAAAEFARYDVPNETLFLRGNPATIEDTEQGRSQAAQITVNLRENKFLGDNPARQGTGGRTRSVYKVKPQ